IDLRYSSREQGEVTVVVAPVMRFADIGFNAKVTIEQLGTPEKIIKGFAPELFGKPVEDEDILETEVTEKDGLSYYQWAVKPFRLVTATATGNRMFILSVAASSRQ
ncbi:PsbP domain-containing protein, partial [Haematococcus lacustris]